MDVYNYVIDQDTVQVFPPDQEGNYSVNWNGVNCGHIYVSAIDEDLGEPIWNGSTPLLNLHAPEIGRYIETVDE
jgi:hypothetical protein